MNIGDHLLEIYQVKTILGSGSHGKTCVAQDEQGQHVLIKCLSVRDTQSWKQLELFEREATILKNLNHPAIPKLLDYQKRETAEEIDLFLISEYIPAPSLLDKLNQGWRPDLEQCKNIAKQILEILTYLHQLHPPVIHRDIKPSNLLFNVQEQVFLVDFGGVQAQLYPQGSGGSTIIGTYGYMAPEQFSGRAIPASDLYSLGASLIHLLSGKSPGEMEQKGLHLSFQQYIQVPEPFEQWLEKITEPNPDFRFQNAQSALHGLSSEQQFVKIREPEIPALAFVEKGVTLQKEAEYLKISIPAPRDKTILTLRSLRIYFSMIPMCLVTLALADVGFSTWMIYSYLLSVIAVVTSIFPYLKVYKAQNTALELELNAETLRITEVYKGKNKTVQSITAGISDLRLEPVKQIFSKESLNHPELICQGENYVWPYPCSPAMGKALRQEILGFSKQLPPAKNN